ncbi:hypothetical protein ACA086_14055 [Muriicola sp. E247]
MLIEYDKLSYFCHLDSGMWFVPAEQDRLVTYSALEGWSLVEKGNENN